MAHFEVGKKVICIKTHSQANINSVKRGTIWSVYDVRTICNCGLQLDIGIIDSGLNPSLKIGDMCRCGRCNSIIKFDSVWWVNAVLFSPLDDMQTELSETTTADILEPEKELA